MSMVLSGCGPEGSGATGGRLDVQASFYPLQWIAERVGDEAVVVSSLTPPGAEPHDLELSAQDVGAISQADLVVYLSGFQAAVDEAVLREAEVSAFDAAEHTDLNLTYNPIEEGEQPGDRDEADVHFWLDPLRLADVADALADRLGEMESDNAAMFTENAQTLRAELEGLDAELRQGLADCANWLLVTSHNAFGYLAEAYGLTQIGITGLTPEEEPSAASLANLASIVEANDVRTIYVETLVSPEIAETIASEAGIETAVLDPIEGLTEESDGADYLEVMRSNLATLRAGQPCR
ncbi:MAG: metal ABC transporter substrate-binding protein [Actinomycetota bacterium]|nr:metal ABC transporter substrate-binding protein [Actinomycetota bacterium]